MQMRFRYIYGESPQFVYEFIHDGVFIDSK